MPQLHIVRRRTTTPRKGVWDKHLRDNDLNPDEYEALTDDELEQYLAEDYSKLESATMGLGRNIGGGVGGAAGMIGLGALASSTGVGAAVGIPMMIAGAIGGAFAGNAVQGTVEDAIYDDEELAQLHRNRRDAELANPVSYFGGEMLPSLLAFKPSPTHLGKALTGIRQSASVGIPGTSLGLAGRGLEPASKQALLMSGVGAGLDVGIEGGRQLYTGDFDPGKLGLAAAIGATLQKPTFKPKGVDALVKRGKERAAMRPKGSWAKPNEPHKVFNLWAEPLPTASAYRAALDTEIYSLYNQGKTFSGDAGTKVGIVENAATPTDSNLAFAIEAEVTRGVGILDPLKPGPAAHALGGIGGTRGAGIGPVPLTTPEVAAAQGVTPKVIRETYGAGAEREAKVQKQLAEGKKELEDAQAALKAAEGVEKTVWSRKQNSYIVPQRPVKTAQTAVNRANKKITKAESDLETIGDIGPSEKTAIKKLFSEAAKPAEVLDPRTGRPRKVRVAHVPKEASERIVDRSGEPLHERLDIWEPAGLRDGVIRDPETGEISQFLGVRVDDAGNFQGAHELGGRVEWRPVPRREAKSLRKRFEDHIKGVKKRADDARIKLEREQVKKLPPLKMDVVMQLAKLAMVRGFNLEEALSRIHLGGSTKAGFAAYDTRTVAYDPRRMGNDTIAHEGLHNFLDDLQYSTNPKDQKLREDFLKLYTSEEKGVEFLGRAMAARIAKRKEATFKELLRESRLRWKHKFNKPLTAKELKDYLLIKYERDHPFIFQDELMDGFAAHRLGERPKNVYPDDHWRWPGKERQDWRGIPDEYKKELSEWQDKKQQLMEDVQAGRPVLASSAIARVGVDDPWKNLKFQDAKKRYNSRGEEVVSKERGIELMAGVKRELGVKDDPDTPAKRSMIDKLLQDTEGIDKPKFQEARGERAMPDEGFLFAAGRDRAKHTTEIFDKVGSSLKDFDPERAVLSGGTGPTWTGVKKFVDPRWWMQRIRYTQAEVDQLLIRPFTGLKNAEIADSTKNMALYARDAHSRLELVEKRYVGRFVEPLALRQRQLNLSKEEGELLSRYRILRRLVKKNYKDLDNDFMRQHNKEYQSLHSRIIGSRKLGDANKELDSLYAQTRDEHIANGPKQKVGDHWRDPKEVQEGYYEPFMLGREATEILKNKPHTKEGKDLQDKIVSFWMKQRTPKPGLEAELRDNLAEYVAVISNKDSFVKTTGESQDLTSASKFNALRKTEGLLMPPDLVDTDAFIRAGRYVGRFAKDMAWFTQIENDHVMRAIRNIPDQEGNVTHRPVKTDEETLKPRTPTLKEIFGEDVDTGYGSRAEKTFRNLDETHAGFHTDWDINILRANRMVTSWWLGPMSGIRDTVTSFSNDLAYMRTQDLPLILKSFAHLGDAWRQSHVSGANRSKLSQIEFAHDSIDRAADAMATVADFSQKYSGRELFERGTRAIQFNLGKLLMRSYINSASDSSHIKRVLTTMGRMADVDTGRLRKNPASATEADLNKLATAFVEINQGTYGVRGVPSAMIRGKSSYFLSLSRWSVEKFNRYLKDVILPIRTEKDFKPLLKATFGAAVAAEVLTELSNMVNAKESYEPTTAELFASDAEFEEFVYHALHMANVSGYFGVLSGLGNDAVRMIRTKKAGIEDVSAVTFPALEALLLDKGVAKTFFSYLFSGEATNPKAVLRMSEDVLTNLNQTLRIARNQLLASSSTARGVDKALGTSYFKGRSAEFNRKQMERDLRVFNRLHRGEHTAGWFQNLDRYEKVPATAYKYSTTMADMEDNVRPFLESAWKRSLVRGKPDPNRFKSLLQQGYQKPSKISPPAKDAYSVREARKFADFIARVRSKDAVRDIIRQEERDALLAKERKRIVQEALPGFLAEKGYQSGIPYTLPKNRIDL